MSRTIASVKRPSKHQYIADTSLPPDHRGDTPCTCRLPKKSDVHTLPDTTEAAAEDRRRLGEHE